MTRHSWFKPRVHVYVCVNCGTGRINSDITGQWSTTYYLPDGTSVQSATVPPCAEGPLTAKYVGKYAVQIAEAAERKAAAKQQSKGQADGCDGVSAARGPNAD